MLRALLSVFRTHDPLGAMGQNFSAMLTLANEMTVAAGEMFFTGSASPEARTNLYHHDVRLNQLERKVRKQVVVHLSMSGNRLDVPYSVLLISLVNDVERIGDYAKNLSEIVDIRPAALAEDEITLELQEIRRGVEDAFEALSGVFASSDRERAVDLIEQRRDAAHRCDALIERIALSDYDARIATACIGNPLLQTDRRSRPQHPVERRHADPQDRLLRRGRNARREAVVNKATSPG